MAVSVAAALLLAALFAGDSVWTALAALLVAGGWGALAFAGRAPQPGGGATLLGVLLATAAWAGLSVAGRWRSTATGKSSTGHLCSRRFWPSGSCSAPVGRAHAAGRSRPSSRPSGPRSFGRWPARRSRLSSPTAAGRHGCAIQSATGTRSRSPPTSCSCCRCSWRRQARSRAAVAGGTMLAYAATVAIPGVRLAPEWLPRCSGLHSGSGSAATASRRHCSRSPPPFRPPPLPAWAFSRPASRRRRVPACRPRQRRRLVRRAAARRRVPRRVLPLSRCDADRSHRAGRRKIGRVLAGVAVAAVLVAAVVAVANAGTDRRRVPGRGGHETSPGRLGSLSSNNRLDWWAEAWDIFRADPLAGAGANSFEVARKRYREDGFHRDASRTACRCNSSQAAGSWAWSLFGRRWWPRLRRAAVGARRRLEGAERDAAAVLSVALALWLAHALVDYAWDFVAVTGPVLFAAGVLAAAVTPCAHTATSAGSSRRRGAGARRRRVGRHTVARRAERPRRGGGRSTAEDLPAAADSADRARSLDPLALAPLLAWGAGRGGEGRLQSRSGHVSRRRPAYSPRTRRPGTSSASTSSIGVTAARRTFT